MATHRVVSGKFSSKGNRKMKKLSSSGEITKWADGVVVEGELVARREGKYDPLLDLRTDDGEDITVSENAGLKRYKLELGRYVVIKCLGKIPLKNGNTCWNFDVEVEEVEDEDLPLRDRAVERSRRD